MAAFFAAVMLLDMVLVTTLSLVATGIFHSLFALQLPFGTMLLAYWTFLFAVSGLAYLVSAVTSPARTTITGICLLAITVLLAGAAPTLLELDEMQVLGPVLYSLSPAKWLVEGLTVAERNASPSIMHNRYDHLLVDHYGFDLSHDTVAAGAGAAALLATGFRLIAVLVFARMRSSRL